MRLDLLAVLVVVLAVLAVPTAAVTGGEDDLGPVRLAPHDGPNGQYATVEDGELEVDFDGLNDRATTTAHDVFTITGIAEDPVRVWVSVAVYRGDDPRATFDGSEDAVTLREGESLAVGFEIDTRGPVPDSGTVTIHAEPSEADGGGGGEDGDGTDGATSPDVVQPPSVVEPPELEPNETVAVGLPDGYEVAVTELDRPPADDGSWRTRAGIESSCRRCLGGAAAERQGADVVVPAGEPVTLAPTATRIGSAAGIDGRGDPVRAVEVAVPGYEGGAPVPIRLRVAPERFDGDPSRAQVARRTADGWQLLPTRVVAGDDETVVIETRTPGFGTIAVFPESRVTYEWTIPNGSTRTGGSLRTTFPAAGRTGVALTVTDALDRTHRADYRVLANDAPNVTIERVGAAGPGEPVTLHANVTDAVGEVTVTWTLPNGTIVTGENVTGTFDEGDVVEVAAEDEFGERDEDALAIAFAGGGGPGPEPALEVGPFPVSLPVAAGVTAGAVALVALLFRSEVAWTAGSGVLGLLGAALARLHRRGPEIVGFEAPRWDPERRCIEIPELRVEAPGGLLATVVVTVTDDATGAVVTKTVDVGGRGSYEARPERIPVYGDVEFSESGPYSLELRAVDANDRVGSHRVAGERSTSPPA
jgi:hypothetical protein